MSHRKVKIIFEGIKTNIKFKIQWFFKPYLRKYKLGQSYKLGWWKDLRNWTNYCSYYTYWGSLAAAGFDSKAIFQQRRFFKKYVKANHMGVEPLQLRKKIFILKRKEYRNLCKLASILISKYGNHVIKQVPTYESWYITGTDVNP